MPNYTELFPQVQANPGGTGTNLSTISIDGVTYQISGGPADTAQLTSLTITGTEFTQNGETATFVVNGTVGTTFSLTFDMHGPDSEGVWITAGAITGTGPFTIPDDGSYEGMFVFPDAGTRTVNRVARLVATNTDDTDNTVNSGLFRQILGHGTTGGADDDIVASFELDITGTTISSSTTILGGDAPYTVELFDVDPSVDTTATALQTFTVTEQASRNNPVIQMFADESAAGLDFGDHTYFLRITDSGVGDEFDILVESETFTVNDPTEGFVYRGIGNPGYQTRFAATATVPLIFSAQDGSTFSTSYDHGNDVQDTTFSGDDDDILPYTQIDLSFASTASGDGTVVVTRTDISPNVEVASLAYDRVSSGEIAFTGFIFERITAGVHISRLFHVIGPGIITGSSANIPVSFTVYSDEDGTTEVASLTGQRIFPGSQFTRAIDVDFTVSGLTPATDYWIQMSYDGESSALVPFTTA